MAPEPHAMTRLLTAEEAREIVMGSKFGEWNSRYLAFCASVMREPDEQWDGKNIAFMDFIRQEIKAFGEAHPESVFPGRFGGIADHAAFDAWLGDRYPSKGVIP